MDCKWYKLCSIKKFYEKGILDKKWVEIHCKADWGSRARYHLEENDKPHTDYMLPDGTISEKLKNKY